MNPTEPTVFVVSTVTNETEIEYETVHAVFSNLNVAMDYAQDLRKRLESHRRNMYNETVFINTWKVDTTQDQPKGYNGELPIMPKPAGEMAMDEFAKPARTMVME